MKPFTSLLKTLPTTKVILAICSALIAGNVNAQTILHNWQFNDAGGTSLSSTTNSGADVGTHGSFISDLTGVTTDGSALTVDNNGAVDTQAWLSPIDLAYTTGVYHLDTRISSWNLTTSNGNSGLFIGFVEGTPDASATVTADFNLTSNGSNMRLQSRIGDTTYSGLTNFATTGTDLLVRVSLDLDANTATLLYDHGSTGSFTTVVTESLNTRTVNGFRFRQSANWSGAAPDTVSIDYLTITQVPEPSTYALILGGIVLGFVAYRRRAKG